MRPAFFQSWCVSVALAAPLAAAEPATEGETLFAVHVQPLLARKCLACHGGKADEIQAGLDLTSRDVMLQGGDSRGDVLVPGDAERSWLYRAVTWRHDELLMPPKQNDRLTEQETWHVRDWINAGAPWPSDEKIAEIREAWAKRQAEGVIVQTSGALSEDWANRRYDPKNLWAYQPLTRPPVPSFRIPHSTLRTPIDAFIHRRLQDLGLTPAPRADRRMLIRRATFDLTGLPPTPEEIAAFLSDPAPHDAAFAKVVDRLLASPQYGEQYARHWLDVVRYADSAGFANDFERPNAWRYRDYVIRSFNADKPYDQFVMQQLAGDELNPHDPEMLIAVGFLRMGPWEQTGMSVAKVTRQQFLDDVISSVGKVFLSHPLECARCHDHKFDPIPTQDYYRIQAVFATTQFAGRDAPFLPDENTTGFARERGYLRQRIDRYQRILDEINTKQERAERAWYAERGLEYAPRQKKLRQDVPNDQIAPRDLGLTVEDMGLERIARKSLVRHTWELDRYEPIAFSVYSGKTPALRNVQSRLMMPDDPLASGTLELTAILSGGDPFSPTQPVTPGVLSALPGSNDVLHPTEWNTIPETVGGRRLEFARWVASAENPLTARSIVNRVWQWHFGQGLAGNANNFGAMGKKPTHPELLDWLACEFVGLQSAPPLRKGGLGG
ncbi:MAG: DUF1549 domain-containing protein, partial [Planctomycetaceae bacterium]